MAEEKAFYIVNPKGAIHIVNEDHAKARLKIVGWRLATAEERTAYDAAGGNQRFDKPLATPFKAVIENPALLAGAEYTPEMQAEAKTIAADAKAKRKVEEEAKPVRRTR